MYPGTAKSIGKVQQTLQNSKQLKTIFLGHYMYPGTTRTQVRYATNKPNPPR